jgi:hypothetical protein
MSTEERELENILENVNQRAQAAQKRAYIFTLIPIAIGLALIYITGQQVLRATQELNATEARLVNAQSSLTESEARNAELQTSLADTATKLETLQTQVTDLEAKISTYNTEIQNLQAEQERLENQKQELVSQVELLSNQVEESGVLRNKFFEGDILVVLKDMSADFPAQTELLEEILTQQSSGSVWLAGGVGPSEFDSPGFASYILTQKGLLSGSAEDLHYKLLNTLSSISSPEPGDIVFYEGGYTMFYFRDPYTQENFVIGMTTFGIVAMKFDFAPIIGIGDVSYP